MFSLYKDSKFVRKYEGRKDMAGLSGFIEEVLESIRPGSRPKDGVKLPEVGASSDEAGASAVKDKPIVGGKNSGSKSSKVEVLAGDNATVIEYQNHQAIVEVYGKPQSSRNFCCSVTRKLPKVRHQHTRSVVRQILRSVVSPLPSTSTKLATNV